jgi:hypothetical protein
MVRKGNDGGALSDPDGGCAVLSCLCAPSCLSARGAMASPAGHACGALCFHLNLERMHGPHRHQMSEGRRRCPDRYGR